MVKRLLFGMLKGLFIGGAIGALVHFALGSATIDNFMNYPLYALVGALSGALAGRPPWQQGAWIASILKAVFGLALGAGLYALGAKFLPAMQLPLPGSSHTLLANQPMFFAPLLAMVYATFVELDDGGEQPEPAVATGVRAGKIALEDIDVGEDEEAAKPAAKSAKKG